MRQPTQPPARRREGGPEKELAFYNTRRILINPEIPDTDEFASFECIPEPAARALPRLVGELMG
jgi:hypothetical protein